MTFVMILQLLIVLGALYENGNAVDITAKFW